jgi:hypothetical protein
VTGTAIPPHHVVDTLDLTKLPKVPTGIQHREQVPRKQRPPHHLAAEASAKIQTNELDRQKSGYPELFDAD